MSKMTAVREKRHSQANPFVCGSSHLAMADTKHGNKLRDEPRLALKKRLECLGNVIEQHKRRE
jgi:hypothetical protein